MGGTTRLESLSVTGGQIELEGASYKTDGGDITFTGAVELESDVTVDSSKTSGTNGDGGDITFTSTVDAETAGTQSLTVLARGKGTGSGGDVAFEGAVGGTTRKLESICRSPADRSTLGAVTLSYKLSLTPSGTITFTGNITLDDNDVEFTRPVVLVDDVSYRHRRHQRCVRTVRHHVHLDGGRRS